MSFAPYIPHPKRQECLTKAGLPSWFDGDPMLAVPQQALDPEKIKAYLACKNANQNNSPFTQLKNTSPERKFLYGALAILAVFGILKFTKVI